MLVAPGRMKYWKLSNREPKEKTNKQTKPNKKKTPTVLRPQRTGHLRNINEARSTMLSQKGKNDLEKKFKFSHLNAWKLY